MLQTKDAREKQSQMKQKRKAALKARLKKVKQRKLIREGKDPALAEGETNACVSALCRSSSHPVFASDSSSSSDEEHMIGPKMSEKRDASPELLTRDETLRDDAPMREWDKGKKNGQYFR